MSGMEYDDANGEHVLSAPLLDLGCAVQPGGPGTFWAYVEDANGYGARYSLTANAFGLLAVLVTGPHEDVVVLSRKSVNGPFDAVGLFGTQDALAVVEKLRGQG